MRTGNNGIFHEDADDQCHRICAIPNAEYQKVIECGGRQYETAVEESKNEIVFISTKQLNEHNIINSGVNLRELDKTGFKMIDRILLQKTNRHFDSITHLLVMAIVGVGSVTFGSKIAIKYGSYLARGVAAIRRKITPEPDDNRARAHNVYLNLKKLQQRQKEKIMCA